MGERCIMVHGDSYIQQTFIINCLMANPTIAQEHGSEKIKHGNHHHESYSLALIQEWNIGRSMAGWGTRNRR